jgi:hypothetical protein
VFWYFDGAGFESKKVSDDDWNGGFPSWWLVAVEDTVGVVWAGVFYCGSLSCEEEG